VSELNREEEKVLQRVLIGDLDEGDPQVSRMREQSSLFRERLGEARKLLRALDRAGSEERGDLAEAESGSIQEGPAPPPAAASLRKVRVWLPLAAAVFLAVLWKISSPPAAPTRTDDGGALGAESAVEFLQPVGEVDAFTRFTWEGNASTFLLEVTAVEPAESKPLQREVQGTLYEPTTAQRQSWQRIRWRVTKLVGGVRGASSEWVEAWLQ
jgi:hypothetical protein